MKCQNSYYKHSSCSNIQKHYANDTTAHTYNENYYTMTDLVKQFDIHVKCMYITLFNIPYRKWVFALMNLTVLFFINVLFSFRFS